MNLFICIWSLCFRGGGSILGVVCVFVIEVCDGRILKKKISFLDVMNKCIDSKI